MDPHEDNRKPDLPDSPDLDEDAVGPPTPSLARRLLMAREARGWVVAAAALVVAAAAIAPAVDVDQLTGLVVPKGNALAVGGDGCSDEDQSGGTGGQSVGCSFSCPDGAGTVSISVEADDGDAGVSGTASCGGGEAHCSGTQTCSATDGRSSGGGGSCSADSDEAWDSGLYVSCSSTAGTAVPDIDTDPDPGTVCPVSKPVPVCVNPVCNQFESNLAAKCQVVWSRIVPLITPTTTSTGFFIDPSGGVGLACTGFVCHPVEPTCVTRDGVRTCVA